MDAEVSVRFQTTFLPVVGGEELAALEFAPEMYSYATTSDSNPKNLLLLATTQERSFVRLAPPPSPALRYAEAAASPGHGWWSQGGLAPHALRSVSSVRSRATRRRTAEVYTQSGHPLTQGLSVQQDGAGAKRLYYHQKRRDGQISRHWFEAERSRHRVGNTQQETRAEALAAAKRGKAVSAVIGTRAMGTRFNALLTVQVRRG